MVELDFSLDTPHLLIIPSPPHSHWKQGEQPHVWPQGPGEQLPLQRGWKLSRTPMQGLRAPASPQGCTQEAKTMAPRHQRRGWALTSALGLGDGVSRPLAHHLGDVQWAVGLLGDGDSSVHRLSLHLGTRWEGSGHTRALDQCAKWGCPGVTHGIPGSGQPSRSAPALGSVPGSTHATFWASGTGCRVVEGGFMPPR